MKQARTWIVLIGSTPEQAQALGEALRAAGYTYTWYQNAASFLRSHLEEHPRCIIVDFDCEQLQLGMASVEDLVNASWRWPLVVLNSRGELPTPIKMIRLQNIIFLDEPYSPPALLRAISHTSRFKPYRCMTGGVTSIIKLTRSLSRLTPREMVIAGEMLCGHSSKQIARRYDLSAKTVELHRSRVLQKMHVNTTTEFLWMYLSNSAR